jgi:hypothetical protein
MLITITLLIACSNNPSSIADQIMEDVSNGEFGFLQGVGGVVLHDSKFRITDRVLEHMQAKQDKPYDVTRDRFQLQPLVFDFPKNIKSYKFLDVWDNSGGKMLKIEETSEKYYHKHDYLETSHRSYEVFKSEVIKKCKEINGCEYNEKKEFIKYEEVVPEKRYKYRVETISGIFKVTICMYLIREEWKVGAIYKENI